MKVSAAVAALLLLAAAVPGRAQAPPPPQPEPVLLEIVRSDAPTARKAEALRQLGQVGTARAVPVLAELLADEKVAHWARITLERIPDPSVPAALRAAIPKLKGRLLAGALLSLGARPSAATGKNVKDTATAVVAPYLREADVEVASAAANALGRIGTADAAKAIEQALPTAPDSVKPLLWDAALRAAATLARTGSHKEAARIYDRLRASGAPAQVRLGAARGAVLARREAGIPLLGTLLEDADRGMFNVALELAHVVPGPEATRAVAQRLPKLPIPRRALVVQALGSRGDKAALPAIRAAAKEGDPAVRIAAINALVKLQDAASLNLLADAAVVKEEAIAATAATALVSLQGASVDETLIRQAGGSDPARSLAAIEALSRRQTRAARPVLLKVAGEGEPVVRLAALKALTDLATDADVEALLALLNKARSAADIEAVEGTLTAVATRSAGTGSPALLAGALGAAQHPQKMALLRILAAVGGTAALQAVRSSLKDSNAEVRESAQNALADWPTADAAPDLLALARDAENPTHMLLALRGFLRLAADESLPVERRLAMSGDARTLITRDEERRQWLGALGAIPSPTSLTLIAPYIGAAEVNEEACSAAVSVARKLLTGPTATGPEVKSQLPAISEVLRKAAQNTKNEDLGTEIKNLQAKVRELQG
jgi:HEAT repeat protein